MYGNHYKLYQLRTGRSGIVNVMEERSSRSTSRFVILICTVGITSVLGALMLGSMTYARSSLQVSSPTPDSPTATPLAEAIGIGGFAENVNPLTGLEMADPSVLERRPLAIKISNAPPIVRPQAGIAQADLVYEHYVEGSLTRFTAIFYTNAPEYVGSIRSARLIDQQIVTMFDALFAYSGASGPIRVRIAESDYADRAYEGSFVGEPLYFRDPNIESPHNLFAVPQAIWDRAEATGVNERPDLEGLVFSEAPPIDSTHSANQIIFDYGPVDVQWLYNEADGLYYRLVNGEPHVDALDGRQITASNVVTIWTHHQLDYEIVESEWQGSKSYSIEMQIWTLGPTTLFRDGLQYDGNWHRWADEDMLTFWTSDTMVERLYLKPGVTWFQVVPLDFAGLTVDGSS